MCLSLIGSARIALNEYSTEAHTLLIAVIDDDGLTYNRTIQFRGGTQPGTFGYAAPMREGGGGGGTGGAKSPGPGLNGGPGL